MFMILGCASKEVNPLDTPVALQKGYKNNFTTPYYEVELPKDIEDVMVYLPKNTTTIRLKMQIANLEDIIYMKLTTEDGFEIDKILRRVEEMQQLGYEQDGYMYEPSIEKDVVTLQIYVPSIYIYKGTYKPKLTFSFKRNSRSVQEKVQLYLARQIYSVTNDNEQNQEKPLYTVLSKYCAKKKKADKEFFTQMEQVNTNRIDLETIKDIEASCR